MSEWEGQQPGNELSGCLGWAVLVGMIAAIVVAFAFGWIEVDR
jgi:hypothetical protein